MAVTEEAAPDAPAAKQPPGMLESLRVRNFRGFQDLRVARLGRINLFAGRNNSGKTALLEALSLLTGAGYPSLAFNPLVTRGAELLAESERASGSQAPGISVHESVWKPMFHELDLDRTIKVRARHSTLGALSLNLDFARRKNVEIKLGGLGGKSVITLQDTLGFVYDSSVTGTVTSQALVDDQGRNVSVYTGDSDSEHGIPLPSGYLLDRGTSQAQGRQNSWRGAQAKAGRPGFGGGEDH